MVQNQLILKYTLALILVWLPSARVLNIYNNVFAQQVEQKVTMENDTSQQKCYDAPGVGMTIVHVCIGKANSAPATIYPVNHTSFKPLLNTISFAAKLSSNAEVDMPQSFHPTNATGLAEFQLGRDGNALYYQLNVTKLNHVIGAQIHVGSGTENGPIVVGLFPSPFVMMGPPTGEVNGLLSSGTITSADLLGPLAGKNLTYLINFLKSETVYVNVHTEENPSGEIRGQIVNANTFEGLPIAHFMKPSNATSSTTHRLQLEHHHGVFCVFSNFVVCT